MARFRRTPFLPPLQAAGAVYYEMDTEEDVARLPGVIGQSSSWTLAASEEEEEEEAAYEYFDHEEMA